VSPTAAPPAWLRDIRTLSLDVDGTLYPLDWRIRLRALLTPGAARPLRLLKAAREPLRHTPFADTAALASALDLAVSSAAHISPQEAAALRQRVDHHVMPALLKGRLSPGVRAALESAHRHGVVLVAFSDHATGPKLEALGIAHLFHGVVSGEACGAYKPGGGGFLQVLRVCGTPAENTLHVGDRADTDGAGALRAGMRAAVLQPQPAAGGVWSVTGVPQVVSALLAAQSAVV
jgi:FMN phosphatase YigB (HAD superfamily)